MDTTLRRSSLFVFALFLLCFALTCTSCTNDVYYGKRPIDYPNTVWVCEEYGIKIYISDKRMPTVELPPDADAPEPLSLGFGFAAQIWIYSGENKEIVFTGKCKFSASKMIVKVEEESIFPEDLRGKRLVFNRQDINQGIVQNH